MLITFSNAFHVWAQVEELVEKEEDSLSHCTFVAILAIKLDPLAPLLLCMLAFFSLSFSHTITTVARVLKVSVLFS